MSICVLVRLETLTASSHACLLFFFFNDTATTEIYTLSLHDALPISLRAARGAGGEFPGRRLRRAAHGGTPDAVAVHRSAHRDQPAGRRVARPAGARPVGDRKSTRLNSSH